MTDARTPVPIGPERPAMDHTCGRILPGGYCGESATWHVIWDDVELKNGLCCDEHFRDAKERWAMHDAHPIGAVCTMPSTNVVWSWEDPPGYCLWGRWTGPLNWSLPDDRAFRRDEGAAMKVFIQNDGATGEGSFWQQEWPDGWRVPAVGEWLLIGTGQFRVHAVQWELEQGDEQSVQLRVVPL